jgi:23S rRNA pseudouridine1911/1915/1917 synthase
VEKIAAAMQKLENEATGRLDRILAAQLHELSRSRIQKLIETGNVTIGAIPVLDASHKLKGGEFIEITIPEAVNPKPQPEVIGLTIVFEDKDLLVIDKPAGMVVHPGAGNATGTLVNALLAHCGNSLSGIGGVKRPGIVHRIDKDTSGLIVVAKNDMAHHGLSEQFAAHGRDGRLQRDYLAFVWGLPKRAQGTIEGAIARSSTNRQKMAISKAATAKEAITHYEIGETFGSPPLVSLLKCHLETGRTHQIRLHMAHIGHPLLGDKVYGSGFKSAASNLSEVARTALNMLKGQALHAATLGFVHPRTGKSLRFESPLPEELEQLKSALLSKSSTRQHT